MARWSETTSGTPPVSHGPSPVAPGYIQALDLRTYAPCLIIAALLLIDFVPRFYQGDSQAYLRTTWEALPPERSWMFGLIANFLLRHTHGYSSFILIQAIFVAAIVIGARRFFQEFVSWQVAYSLTAIALCLDPLIEVYIRFYMADILALACFIVCLLGMLAAIDPDASRGSIRVGLLTYVLGAIAGVFLRVALLPVLELTAVFVSLHCWRRLCGSGWTKFALMVCTPMLAAGLLAGANSIVFAKQYPHEFFLTKLSGVGIAGVYAPALKIEDFASAGIAITPEEFQNMNLGNYEMRWTHVWSRSSNHLAFFLGEKLNADFGSNTVDAAEKRLVMAALLRSPQSFAKLYLRILWDYASPFQWQFSAQEGMGLKPLPDDFVSYFNSFSVTKLTPETSEIRSPLVRLVEKSLWLYPLLLGLGICAAIFLLLREGARPAVTVLGAALFADLLAVPLFSLGTAPRYVLAAIFVSYLLIGLAGLSLFSSRMGRKTRKSHP